MPSVDERVVQMRFDNQQFESGVHTTLGTLDKLKASLNFKGTKSLDPLASAADAVSKKFSAMGTITDQVLRNITNRVQNVAHQMATELTTKPMIEGFKTYETRLQSYQTTLFNGIDQLGNTLSKTKVNSVLDELNDYSDKTIYRLTDMTSALAKFSTAGVDVDTAAKAIKGMANEAALAGADTNQFGRALQFGVTQALGMGYMLSRDWMSLETAGMATKDFKQQLIEAGLAAGTLEKKGKNILTVSNGTKVTWENLRGTLADKWVTNDVLMGALSKYADDTNELGKKGLQAAQEVKTFHQLLDVLGDSIASSWSRIYSAIIGDYDQAKQLWTGVDKVLENLFQEPINNLGKFLQKVNELGGRASVIKGLENVFFDLMAILRPIKDAFQDIFPPKTAQEVANIAKQFEKITSKFFITDKAAANLKRTFRGVFAVFDIVKQAIGAVIKAVAPAGSTLASLGGGLLNATGNLGDFLVALDEFIKKNNIFEIGITKVKNGIGSFVDNIKQAISVVKALFSAKNDRQLKDIEEYFGITKFAPLVSVFSKIKDFLVDIRNVEASVFRSIANGFTSFDIGEKLRSIGDIFAKVKDQIEGFTTAGKKSKDIFKPVGSVLSNVIKNIGQFLKGIQINGAFDLVNLFNGIGFTKFIFTINKILKNLASFTDNPLKNFFDKLKDLAKNNVIVENFQKLQKSVVGFFSDLQNKLKAETLGALAKAIAILTVSLVALSFIDGKKLGKSLAAIAGAFAELLGVMFILGKLDSLSGNKIGEKGNIFKNLLDSFKPSTVSTMATAIIKLSAAMAILTPSIVALSKLSWDELARGLVGMGAGFAAMVGVIFVLSKVFSSIATADGALKNVTKSITKVVPLMIVMAYATKLMATAIKSLSSLSWGELGRGLLGAASGLAAMVGALVIINKFGSELSGRKLLGLGVAFLGMSVGVLAMASALKSIASLSGWDSVQAVATLGSSLVILAVGLTAMRKSIVGALALDIAAGGLIALGGALKIVASLSGGDSFQAVATLGSSLVILAVGLTAMSKSIVGALALDLAAGGLIALAGALKVIASLSGWDSFQAVATLGSSLIVLSIGLTAMSESIIGALALAIAAGGLIALAGALKVIASLSGLDSFQAVATLGSSLIMLAVGLTAMIAAIPGAIALDIAAGGLIAFAGALKIIASLSGGDSFQAVITLGTSLIMLAVGLTAMIAAIPGAIALDIAAGGLVAFAGALKIIASMSGGDSFQAVITLGTSLIMLAVGLTALIAAIPGALALDIVAGGLIAFGGALKIIASLSGGDSFQAVVTLGTSLIMLAVGLTAMIAAIPGALALDIAAGGLIAFAGALKVIASLSGGDSFQAVATLGSSLIVLSVGLSAMSGALPGAGVLLLLGPALSGLVTPLKSIASIDASALSNSLTTLAEGFIVLGSSLPTVLPNLLLLSGTFSSLAKDGAGLASSVTTISSSFQSIAVSSSVASESMTRFSTAMDGIGPSIKGVSSSLTSLSNIFNKIGTTFSLSMATGFLAGEHQFKSTAVGVALRGASSLLSAKSRFINVGLNFAIGLANGISSGTSTVVASATNVANAAVNATRSTLQVHSPSKILHAIGQFFVKGFSLGIGDSKPDAANSAADMAQTAIDSAKAKVESGFDDINALVNSKTSELSAKMANLDSKTKFANRYGTTYGLPSTTYDYDTASHEEAKGKALNKKRAEAAATRANSSAIKDNTAATDENTKSKKKNASGSGSAAKASKDNAEAKKQETEELLKQQKVIDKFNKYSVNVLDSMNKGYSILWSTFDDPTKMVDTMRNSLINLAAQMWITAQEGTDSSNSISSSTEDTANDTTTAAEKTAKAIKEHLVDIEDTFNQKYESYKSKIKDGMDLFSKFDNKLSDTKKPEEILKNAQSQIDGYTRLGQKYIMLAGRGVPQNVLSDLIDSGVEALPKINAMLSMSDDQLNEYLNDVNNIDTISDKVASQALAAQVMASTTVQWRKAAQAQKGISADLRSAYLTFQKTVQDAQNANVDLNKTTFGNIDMNSREVLKWTDENIDKYKDVLADWHQDTKNLKGTISTILGSYGEFGDGLNIAFTPLLQTGTGEPVLLSSDTVNKYIEAVLNKVNATHPDGFTTEDILGIDAQGLMIDGQLIKDLIADVGDTAEQTSEAMHYVGTDSEYMQSWDNLKTKLDAAGISFEDLQKKLSDTTQTEQAAAYDLMSTYSAAGQTVMKWQEEYETMSNTVKSTIESQVGLFDKLELKSDMTAQTMIDNFKSQVTGIQTWGDELQKLSDRNILNTDILEQLAALGPEGYDKLHAFYTMSDDQLNQINTLYQQKLTLTDSVSSMVGQSFANAAVGGISKFNEALAIYTGQDSQFMASLQGLSTTVQQAIISAVGTSSDSVAQQLATILATAISNNSGSVISQSTTLGTNASNAAKKSIADGGNEMASTARAVGKKTVNAAGENINAGKGAEQANDYASGIINEINAQIANVYNASLALGNAMNAGTHDGAGNGSPSWKGAQQAMWYIMGVMNGLAKMETPMTEKATETGSLLSQAIGAAFTIDDSSPVITPVLDLSNVQNGAATLSNMLDDSYGLNMTTNLGKITTPADNSAALAGTIGNFSNADVVNAIVSLQKNVDTLGGKIAQMQIVLDSGEVVGAVSNGVSQNINDAVGRKEAVWA